MALDRPPEARALPILFTDMRQDLGRIEPHKGRFPPIFEDALFFLLLAPWEDWSRMPEIDWRGFPVPWIYTVDEDLFVRPPSIPAPDSLSWEPQALTDAWGEVIEVERPLVLPLEDGCASELRDWDDRGWDSVIAAQRSPLFDTPVAHFFVRAFLSDGIDEVLGHLTTIEAALGVQADYDRRLRSKADKGPGATRRVAARVAALLGGHDFGNRYEQLFQVRSAFLHGRAMGAISTAERVEARRLARQVVTGLVERGAGEGVVNREQELDRLLDEGLKHL